MFYADKPINNSTNDCLKRKTFSQQLAQAILSYTEKDNFTISLCGKWGSGKTSIINMTIESINELTKDYTDGEKPIIIKFNPWNYSSRTQLISQFFQTVQYVLKTESKNDTLKKAGDALQNYASILEYAEYIPVVGEYLKPIKQIVEGVGKGVSKISEDNNSLENQKKKVISALGTQNQKLIVIIDDIDRLNNEQIRLIFQLVNSLAGFPNMIYLLSFDYSVVVRALEEEQKCSGAEYLEKIIQVPFDIPEVNVSLVHEMFFDKLENILFGATPCDSFDSDYWNKVFQNCIAPFIQSIRDVNRITNVYRFKYGIMHNETNCIDLLALTTLQICAPTIYNWIYSNINVLTGSYYREQSVDKMNTYKDELIEKFKNVYSSNPSLMLNIVRTLFPKFNYNTNGYQSRDETDKELRRKQRIACPDKSQRYFDLSLDNISITKQQILSVIQNYDKHMVELFFTEVQENDKLYEFLKEFLAYVDDIPVDKINLFFGIMIKMQVNKSNYERKSIFSPIPAYKCNECCWAMLKTLDKNGVEKVLSCFLETSDIDTFAIITGMVLYIEEDYGRIGNSPDYNYRVIDECQLASIEKIILQLLNKYSQDENFLDIYGFSNVYRLWRYIDKESLDNYFSKAVKKATNVPKYLMFCAGTWSGGKETGWFFKEDSFSEYIAADDAYEKIMSLKNTAEFSGLAMEIKEIAIAYYLWYNSDRQQHHDISKSKVNEMIPEWEVTL